MLARLYTITQFIQMSWIVFTADALLMCGSVVSLYWTEWASPALSGVHDNIQRLHPSSCVAQQSASLCCLPSVYRPAVSISTGLQYFGSIVSYQGPALGAPRLRLMPTMPPFILVWSGPRGDWANALRGGGCFQLANCPSPMQQGFGVMGRSVVTTSSLMPHQTDQYRT